MQMTSFSFATKAKNLLQIGEKVKESCVLPLIFFTVEEWLSNQDKWLYRILSEFHHSLLAVRSSSVNEDTFETSGAGKFSSLLNVEPVADSIKDAIHTVIASYGIEDEISYSNEILIQPMLQDVKCSGVLFTRTLDSLSPYYVINYDDTSALTDSVTSGAYGGTKHIMIYRNAEQMDEKWKGLIAAALELEHICNCDTLDIEFAITNEGRIVIFQVRPLVTNVILHLEILDQRMKHQLNEIKQFIGRKLIRMPGMYGERTIFGQMPDWNPAEIIGTRPKPLAYSLYRYLIMDTAWREGRRVLGYQSPDPYSLMVQIGGRPYVDVRASFNSLIPQGMSSQLSEKLINYYISRLRENPNYHDKVEFYVVHTCLDFSFQKTENLLIENDFSSEEIDEIYASLHKLTVHILKDENKHFDQMLKQIEMLQQRRVVWEDITDSHYMRITAIQALLKDCIAYGTVPFSSMARCAFIGTQLMRSLVDVQVMSEDNLQNFLHSIETIAGEYTSDLREYNIDNRSLDYLCRKYGHLRPGTYDITADRYDDKPDIYFSKNSSGSLIDQRTEKFTLSKEQYILIQEILEKMEFGINAEQMIEFVRRSIALRERFKFEFTKNISLALKYIEQFGAYYGFTDGEMAFVPIEYMLRWEQESPSESFIYSIRKLIDEQQAIYNQQNQIALPDLIMTVKDIDNVELLRATPNFISNLRIIGEALLLQGENSDPVTFDMKGKIIMIEQADPGYDWLFSRGIAGLITKYGGVASHMAIRCSEFNIPAVIGCGEWLFNELKQSRYVEMNCQEKRVFPCEVFL